MNECLFSGHLANEPELKTTTNGKSVCSFRLAVQRRVPNAQGVREADFFTIIMWGKNAESAAKWLHKGTRINVGTEARNRSYDAQDGSKRYVTEFNANWWEFAGARTDNANGNPQIGAPAPQSNTPAPPSDDFQEVEDDELPF